MHSLPAVCIVTFVLMDYLHHFCRQLFVLPGFITIFQILVKPWRVTFSALQHNEILPFAPPSQVLSAINFIRSCLFTSDGSRRKKLPPHSRNPFPPEAACFPCSAALPRFVADGSPPPGSLRFRGSAPYVQVAVLCRLHPPVQRSVRYLKFLAGSLYSYFQRQLYWLLLVALVVFLCFWQVLHPPDFSIFFWAWGVKFYYTTSVFNCSVV